MKKNNNFLFCLGGHDLEMLTIKQLLAEHNQPILDKQLTWGAAASAYQAEINKALQRGVTPVLIELDYDLILNPAPIIIDHHGSLAGKNEPTALHQVFKLLSLPPSSWSRWFDLVAANDKDHITGLQAINATQTEIIKIRAADRRAQGITADEELSAKQAIANMEIKGSLSFVSLPHNHCATVVDALHPALGGVGYDNLLIISPQEVNFFGKGEWVQALAKAFPNSWYGGALPQQGFWGSQKIAAKTVIDFIKYNYY